MISKAKQAMDHKLLFFFFFLIEQLQSQYFVVQIMNEKFSARKEFLKLCLTDPWNFFPKWDI